MENKRKRERSFEYLEKSILIEIVTEHFAVIESKKTDGLSIKLKNAEWQKIAEKFAAASSTYPRDSHSLKTLWENLKRKAKVAMAIEADNNYGTGGGKAMKSVADPIVDVVVGLIGKKGVSRRPALTTTLQSETFLEAKKLSLDASSRDAGEEHKLQMKILRLRVEQEAEKLKQEKMKTEILKLQFQRESGTEWVFDDNNEADNTD
ncbi:unnamed protein product [Macrosiphum euphorbiae]|uniref:Regulatory protein zeste n=1 Tax=Macrosiphum euphorbiae TaxID=13131 RepID=A0AAV0XAS2_9HEMI|nr:unnamed protein product [Macrosiphum euphorbiae]